MGTHNIIVMSYACYYNYLAALIKHSKIHSFEICSFQVNSRLLKMYEFYINDTIADIIVML